MKTNTLEYNSEEFEPIPVQQLFQTPQNNLSPQIQSFSGEQQGIGASSPLPLPVAKPKPLPTYEPPKNMPDISNLGNFPNLSKEKPNNFWKFYSIGVIFLIIFGISYLIYKSENGGILREDNQSINISNQYDIALNPSISSPVTNNNNNDFKNNFTNEFTFEFDLSEELINRICNNS